MRRSEGWVREALSGGGKALLTVAQREFWHYQVVAAEQWFLQHRVIVAEWGPWQHRVVVDKDKRPDTVLFRWNWPRNVLDKRMSALELSAFLLPHLPSVVPLLADYPQAQVELQALLVRLVTWPRK